MSWPSVKIGEVADVLPGFAFKSKELGESGTPVLKIGNILDSGGVDLASCQCLPDNHKLKKHDKFRLRNRDIIIAMTGATAGKVGRIHAPEEEVFLLNQRVAKFTPRDINPDFLWFAIGNEKYRAKFYGLGGGAAQPNMSGPQIAAVEIPLPDLPTQVRISGVLSAYDDLIENNRRRIALLEQAARLLYREWFVHFRFPGYETAKFIDGLPEGWEETTIKQHCPFAYGKALKADTRVEGSFDVFGSSGIVGSHNKSLVAEGAIIVGRKGNVGSVFWSEKGFWPIDTVYYIAPENSDYFTFFALKHMNFISTDVAVPGLNRDFAHSRKLVLPTAALQEDFNTRAALYFGQVQALTKANDKLAKARDLLLPRLMDGRLPIPE